MTRLKRRRPVAATAALTAMYRAMETERPDAIVHDDFAMHLTKVGALNTMELQEEAQAYASPIAVRTLIFDELIVWMITNKKVDTVMNLGGGFDTRPYRLSLPNELRWIEADRAVVLSYKERRLKGVKAKCQLEHAKLDLCDLPAIEKLFQRINEHGRNVLVICEGVLLYLAEAQVAALSHALYRHQNFKCWLTDYVSPLTLAFLKQTLMKELHLDPSQLKFAPEAGCRFFEAYGWKVALYRSFWDETLTLKREMPWMAPMRGHGLSTPNTLADAFRLKDGCVLLERVDDKLSDSINAGIAPTKSEKR